MERVASNARIDEGPQAIGAAAELVVLLGSLDDSREVDPAEALQLLGLFCDVVQLAQNFLQYLLPLLLAGLRLLGRIARRVAQQALALAVLVLLVSLAVLLVFRLDPYGQWFQLLLAGRGPVAQLLRDVGDEVVHLFQLHVGQLINKRALVVGSPGIVVLVVFQQLLELVVVDVFVLPWRIHALAQCRTELHGLEKWKHQAIATCSSNS